MEEMLSVVETVVIGQHEAARYLAGAFLLGRHVLLEGPPGVGKTMLAKTFAHVVDMRFSRIQFTPDLMPGDITGVSVFDRTSGEFRFIEGALFADVVLADEVNRTPPKTQAALLEAMEERSVTVDGAKRPLGEWFFVVATRNPIEHEGTFPLPEAQLDRFMFEVVMGYPPREVEEQLVQERSSQILVAGNRIVCDRPPVSRERLDLARKAIIAVVISPTLMHYVLDIVAATREHPDILLGASTRAALHLALATKMNAAWEGRSYAIPDDVRAVLQVTLAHRIFLRPESFDRRGGVPELVRQIGNAIPAPETLQEAQ
jgi:MoxR-like ATPase